MIKVVAIELIDAHADRAGADERIEVELLVVEKAIHARNGLVRVVTADHAGVGDGIVRLGDPGQQQELHVEDRIRGEDDEIGRQFPFLSPGIDEGDTSGVLARSVHIDFGDLRVVTRGEVGFAHQDWEDRRLWTGLGVIGAAEPFAKNRNTCRGRGAVRADWYRRATNSPTAAGTACNQVRGPPWQTTCG